MSGDYEYSPTHFSPTSVAPDIAASAAFSPPKSGSEVTVGTIKYQDHRE